ncbi:unnamed protein product [Ambrosiozyma monospora]|uniref:Unnamed protein product n=1 Tax=Ambrosiozyma monospora TaxID=43982 RepID=A0ACB5SX30_AMBMO|nr:unnamed protein product [Ambrosiozyma monospora]
MSVKLDEEKGLFYLSYTWDHAHTHSSCEVVEMGKVRYTRSLQGKSKQDSRALKPKSQLSKQVQVPVDIPEDDRFKLKFPSKVSWSDLVLKLREPQLYELEPGVLNLIHQTYISLIDLKDKIHFFTTSQFLQLLSVYIPFLRLLQFPSNKAYLRCPKNFKCINQVDLQWFPVNIPEDARFKLEFSSNVGSAQLMAKLRKRQRYKLKPGVLDLIHRTYTDLIDSRDKIHVFTTSQFLQFLSVYLLFVRLHFYHRRDKVYIRCSKRFKCKSALALNIDGKKGLFYLSYTRDPAHSRTSGEIVDMAKQRYERRTHWQSKYTKSTDVDVQLISDSFDNESNDGSEIGGDNNQVIRIHATSNEVTLSDTVRDTGINEGLQTSSAAANEQSGHEESGQTMVKEETIISSEDIHIFDDDAFNHDDINGDKNNSQKFGTYPGFVSPNAEECSMITEVTNALQSGGSGFSSSGDIDELMYYTNRLYNVCH